MARITLDRTNQVISLVAGATGNPVSIKNTSFATGEFTPFISRQVEKLLVSPKFCPIHDKNKLNRLPWSLLLQF